MLSLREPEIKPGNISENQFPKEGTKAKQLNYAILVLVFHLHIFDHLFENLFVICLLVLILALYLLLWVLLKILIALHLVRYPHSGSLLGNQQSRSALLYLQFNLYHYISCYFDRQAGINSDEGRS